MKAKDLSKLILIGSQMSNVCYNLGQELANPRISPRNKRMMMSLAKQWSEALRATRSREKS